MTPFLAAFTGSASIVGTFHDIAERAADYGYWAVLLVVAGDGVFPALPGETAIVTAAVRAAAGPGGGGGGGRGGGGGAGRGAAPAGRICRAGGGPIKRTVTRFAGAARLAAAERMVERQGPALVFVGRFLPGIRIAINLSCGAGRMTYPRFLLFDSMGAVVWSAQAALLGYFAGKAFADQLWVAFIVAFAVTGVVALYVARRERRRVRAENAAAAAEAAGERPREGARTEG